MTNLLAQEIRIASYGGGVNSTAMLIGMQERGEQVDLILFADTGGEKPETYKYLETFSAWLTAHGFPEIITVRKTTKKQGKYNAPGHVLTLEEHCHQTRTLPSMAFRMRSCSMKFKVEPQNEYVEQWAPALATWELGKKIEKLIGFDAEEGHRVKESPDPRYRNRYPLVEWQWGRDLCIDAIRRVGLCVPPKSSCFFCPNMSELEILELRDKHPELLDRALAIEKVGISTIYSDWPRGLGCDYSWQQILKYDKDQMRFIPRGKPTVPCECYDGE